MYKVCLVLIHNHNAERNAYVRPRLGDLNATLLMGGRVQSFEIAYQSEIKPHSFYMAFLRDVIYLVLVRDWCRYRYIKSSFVLRDIYGLLRKTFRPGRLQGWVRSSAIEMAVTDKHIRAWAAFLDTDNDFLICFEDDAVFKKQSNQRLANLLDRLVRENLNKPVYIDLAGGCTFEALRIEKLETGQDSEFRYYRKPVTNTACVYLMSRPLVALFYATLTQRPWLRMIGVDWMINKF